MNNYYDFVKNNAFPIEKSELSYTKNICVNGIEIAVVGLNSAWGSNSNFEKGNIILGERQVIEAFSKIHNPQVTITLLHHPIYYFRDEDVESVESVINNRSDFVLHGHIHRRKVITQKMPDSMVHYLVAGASYEKNGASTNLAYNYVSADFESGIADIYLRKYDSISSCWVNDKSYGENGKSILLLRQSQFKLNDYISQINVKGIDNKTEIKQAPDRKIGDEILRLLPELQNLYQSAVLSEDDIKKYRVSQ